MEKQNQLKQVFATVISNIELMPGHHLMSVKAPDIAEGARPGQFISINCGQDFILRRPLSIHRVDKKNQISILFAVVGAGTYWLSQRRKGEKLDLLSPLGNGFIINPESKKLLLAAGGIGIAPLVFLAQKALSNRKSVKLIMGTRTKDCLYPKELLPKGIETVITTEDGSDGVKGKVTDILPKYADWADQVCACGPLAMYQSIGKQSNQWQSKPSIQISLEVRIGCGIGACFGCSIKTKKGMKQVCRDGPVFNLDEVILEEVRI
jgi:dihydroorotate dehydrogenase electron transfer subunit